MKAYILCLPIPTWKLRTLFANQMRITKETTTFGLSKNTATGNFKSASQRRLSTQARIGPTWKSFAKMSKVNLFHISFWGCRSGNWKFSSKNYLRCWKKHNNLNPQKLLQKWWLTKLCSSQLMWRKKQNSMCFGNWVRLLGEKYVWPEHFTKMIRIDVISASSSSLEGLKRTVLEGNASFLSELGSCRNYIEWAMKLFQCWTKSKTRQNRKVHRSNCKLL